MSASGKRTLYTEPGGNFDARSRLGVTNGIEASWENIEKELKGEKVEKEVKKK